MSKLLAFLYGLVCYLAFLAAFLYAIGFTAGLTPTSIDAPPATGSLLHSVLIDAGLLGLFALQHSVMARPAFKAWWTKLVPVPIERSTYVLFSSVLLLIITTQWQALPQAVWTVDNQAARLALVVLFWSGWAVVLLSSFFISHFDLFGLRQVYLYLRSIPSRDQPFVQVWLYRIVRHPLMLGFLMAFWATPRMSVGHLLFTVGTSGYIFLGIWFEERDLVRAHGERYRDYQKSVPMVLPFAKRTALPTARETTA